MISNKRVKTFALARLDKILTEIDLERKKIPSYLRATDFVLHQLYVKADRELRFI